MQYGMAVVDISDLDGVRYGIVAFGTFQPLMSNGEFAEAVLEPTRPRQPLSAEAYMNKFASAEGAKEIDKLQLEKYQLVGLDALEDLLRTAYAEQTHLNWVTFSHLSPAVIGSAIKSLKHARSISLCIDQINGAPAEIISALAAHSPPFDSLYLHQTPTRQTDQPTADFLAHLAAHPQLARTPNIFLTGIFSASLRRTILLSPQTFTPHFPPFLIQHLILRHTHPTDDDDDDDDDDESDVEDIYYYLGDTPYRAERFATGFLHLLRALAQGRTAAFPDPHSPDDLLRDTLCGAPPTLRDDDLFVAYEDEPATARAQVAPLPCENRSVPWLAARCGVPRALLFRGECWPLVRTAPDYSDADESEAAGLWSVVVDVGVSGEDGKPVVGPNNTLGALFDLSSDSEEDGSDSDDSDDEAEDMLHIYPGPD
ncbi:hypothetical protein NEMBOFW57_004518 [Staphylotrichum longicolle]|uniref:Uncharacterized protein n=1 Tax=Staphylotrichum longicolle TaxID=669026 RepID=A0AAD4F7T3_9PEZI|nr:hypothetical protein NEMBOFW57_004518 [Staphylotrichum longicolle]